MRVLQISGTYVGAQKEIEYGIHSYLKKKGHESHILYGVGDSDDLNIIGYETGFEEYLRRFLHKYVSKSPHTAYLQTIRIIRYIKSYKPDIVHLHILHHGHIDYVILLRYLAKKKIPTVYTLHDLWPATGGCYHNTTSKCDKYIIDCKNCPLSADKLDCRPKHTAIELKQKLKLYSKMEKLIFVAVSPWLKDEIAGTKLSNFPRETVMNSVSASPCVFDKFDKGNKFKIIGVANYWSESKGLYRFFDLARILGSEYQITLVGGISDEDKTNVPKNIELMGAVRDRALLYKLYAESDINISLSYEETFGMTVVEAALVGRKSVVFGSTALPQIAAKVYGYVVDSLSTEDMAKRIIELSEKPELCSLTGSQIHNVIKYFSPERMAGEYLKIYEDIRKN